MGAFLNGPYHFPLNFWLVITLGTVKFCTSEIFFFLCLDFFLFFIIKGTVDLIRGENAVRFSYGKVNSKFTMLYSRFIEVPNANQFANSRRSFNEIPYT